MLCQWLSNNLKKVLLVTTACCLAFLALNYNYFSLPTCQPNNIRIAHRAAKRTFFEAKPRGEVSLGNSSTTTTTPSPSGLVECAPKEHVLFLKTHKTGSSTLTNILNRFADRNNLTVLLPRGQQYYSFDWPNKFRLNSAASLYKRPNFLANHARYSRRSMDVLFPRDRTVYISVLRHPVAQWESTFQYMSFPYILDIGYRSDPLDFFLKNPPSTENIVEIARRYPSLYLIRNPLFFDLGLDYADFDNATYVRRALKTLDNDFDLMLITEHFDESLTLLRRRLCWSIDDVVYFKMNERLNKDKRRVVTAEQTERIKTWNHADVVLYNYFVERFWRQVKNEGEGFYDEVFELRKRRQQYTELCIERDAVEEAYSSVYVKGYKMRGNLKGDTLKFCERMLRNELHFIDYFRKESKRKTQQLEGDTIKNFEDSRQEANIFVEMPEISVSSFRYGAKAKANKMKKKLAAIANNKKKGGIASELTGLVSSMVLNSTVAKQQPKYDGKTISNTTMPWTR